MDLALWRWSTAVQVTSLAMIAAFFMILARRDHRAELSWWVKAWCANVLALTVTLFYWYFAPEPPLFHLAVGGYAASKMAFVLLLLQGARVHVKPGAQWLTPRALWMGLTLYFVAAGLSFATIASLGAVQHAAMAAFLIAGGLSLARTGHHDAIWLIGGIVLRGALALVEAGVYTLQLAVPTMTAEAAARVGTFLAVASSFDAGAEWLLVLGCVLALSNRAQRELRETNRELLAAQEDLRRLADRDVLTGLDNRRVLPEVFRAVQPHGALLLFFDLNGFKHVNDRFGHLVGDQCLKRVAAAIRESFRPDDAVIRYGGDEFLVIAAGLDQAQAIERLAVLRDRLRQASREGPTVDFSVGIAELEPGGHPDVALQAADAAMYHSRRGTTPAPVAVP